MDDKREDDGQGGLAPPWEQPWVAENGRAIMTRNGATITGSLRVTRAPGTDEHDIYSRQALPVVFVPDPQQRRE